MSDIELRLRDALAARAELVRPEDLTLAPDLEPGEPEPGAWWQRPSGYLLVAAIAVIVVVLPLLALAAIDPDGEKSPSDPATDPSGTFTMTDPVRTLVAQDKADVDGDSALDDVRVMSLEEPDAVLPDFDVEVELSASGESVSYQVGQARDVKIGATANLDGREGEEIVLALDADTVDLHRAQPLVVSLRDGELVSILTGDLRARGRPGSDGTRTYWWVHDGQLWWWRSQEPVADGEESPYAVEVLRFPREAMLRGVDHGTWCVTSLASTRLLECAALD
ncbi:hypothetical protein [Nocardioides bizhenqiangii]|uniref:Uncharacterized protein n=1 Tax=Nocardioides bizhenqiangii TaxID=3095076 RepID=A0ABZ0ZT49_9ACTN|nr:hypothetical protein [Nocardioides sp. HM61]WQQ27079.1 hypothetical protein SHK19_02360 [Nocardioides sp. HM61]